MISEALRIGLEEAEVVTFSDELGSRCRQGAEYMAAQLSKWWTLINEQRAVREGDRSGRAARAKEIKAKREEFINAEEAGKEDLAALPCSDEDIFAQSNQTFDFDVSQGEYAGARCYDDLFGSDPAFQLTPVGTEDAQLSKDVDRWFRDKLDQSESLWGHASRILCRDGTALPYVVGGVLHEQYAVASFCRVPQPKMVPAVDEATGEPILDPATNEPAMQQEIDAKGRPAVTWEEEPEQYKSGLRFIALHHLDFLFDPNNPDPFDRQPFTARQFDLRRDEVEQLYEKGTINEEEYDTFISQLQPQPRSRIYNGITKNDTAVTEAVPAIDGYLPVIQCHMNYPVPVGKKPDGSIVTRQGRLYALVSVLTGKVIYADFLKNVFPEGKVPFVMFAIEPTTESLFSQGIMSKTYASSQILDTGLNLINMHDLQALGTPVAVNRERIKELQGNKKPLRWNRDIGYTITGTGPINEIVVPLQTAQPLEGNRQYLMEYTQQQAPLRTGITSAASGDIGSLPQSQTATGVNQIINFGSVLFKFSERNIQQSFQQLLMLALKLSVQYMEETEFFRFTNETGMIQEGELKRSLVEGLKFDIRMKISRSYLQEQQQQQSAAGTIIDQFLAYGDPVIMEALIPTFEQRLQALEVSNARDVLTQIVQILTDRAMMAQQQGLPPEEGGPASAPVPTGGPAPVPPAPAVATPEA